MVSIHLLLLVEQKLNPELPQLTEELCRNTNHRITSRLLPHFTRDDGTKLSPIRKVKTIKPVRVAINVDSVDMNIEGHFLQGLYLGRQEVRCCNIGVQDVQSEAWIRERALLVVAFGTTLQERIPLYGLINTGSGVCILSLSAYQKIASSHSLSLYQTIFSFSLCESINTIGISDRLSFRLGGHTLKISFIVIADHSGAEDFLLGSNFLRTYNVLVDLIAMRVTIRDPKSRRQFKDMHEVTEQDASFVVPMEKVVLDAFES